MNNIIEPHLGIFTSLGPPEVLIIFLVLLLLFGGKKLPELARGLGKSMREFKRATREIEDDFHQAMDASEREERARKEREARQPAPTPAPQAQAQAPEPVASAAPKE